MVHTEESLMALVEDIWKHREAGARNQDEQFENHWNAEDAANALRFAIREVLKEYGAAMDTLAHLRQTELRAERAEAELAATKVRLLEVQQEWNLTIGGEHGRYVP